MVTTLTSRAFNQDTSGAKKAAKQGPVFITDRGTPAHVLLSIEDYRKLAGKQLSLAEALVQTDADNLDAADFAFTPSKIKNLVQVADLS